MAEGTILTKITHSSLTARISHMFQTGSTMLKNFRHVVVSTSLLIVWFAASCVQVYANNVDVSNGRLTGKDTSADTILIEFDLSWSNSWYDSTNSDAVWAFFKFSTDSGVTWSHASLKTAGTNPTGFSVGSGTGLNIVVPTDKKGCFLQRSSLGTGSVSTTNIQVVWNYGQDGVSDSAADAGTTSVRAYGIEMVYIPEGGFYAGDGNTGTDGEFEFGSGSSLPPAVSSETSLSFTGDASGNWYYNTDSSGDDDASGTVFILGQAFPKGFQAFYAMKYEITQGQYRNFLNSLTQAQQQTRVVNVITDELAAGEYVMLGDGVTSVADRQAIKAGSNPANGVPYTFGCDLDGDGSLNESDDGEWVAMNYISWMDLAAYGDWAGLRPMTDLEFEKAARGPTYPTTSEYVWGTTGLTQAQGALTNGGQASEVASNTGNGLANYDGAGTDIAGPARVGFGVTASTTRVTGALGFYGNADLSGNVWERVVTVGNSSGRSFAGSQGDGTLSTNGNATNVDWPGISSGEVTGAAGSAFRGGAWDETTAAHLRASNRAFGGDTDTTRRLDSGGRLVRTAS